MKLTVGMATYDDFCGVWMTVQGLRLMHPEIMRDTEILVVDNNPGSPDGQATKDFMVSWVADNYCRSRYIPYDEIIGTAAPRNLIFREATGDAVVCIDSHVLISPGALKDLIAFYQNNPGIKDLIQGVMVYDNLVGVSTHFSPVWRAEMWGIWGTDPRGDINSPDYRGEPFEIWGQGLGLFSCCKDAWLGFNPKFRGFGGEEGYIHEKYRQAGRRTLCLPWLRWIHRFGRPNGQKYPLTKWHKIRNYVIGFAELGMSLEPIHEHFVASGLMPESEWEELTADPINPPEWPKSAQQAFAQQARGREGCRGCNHSTIPQGMSLEAVFHRALTEPSDINEHCLILRTLAGQCQRVTDFGMRHGVSTVAMLAGASQNGGSITSYYPRKYPEVEALSELGKDRFRFLPGDSLSVEIEETDLLFLDTRHTAGQVYMELTRHSPKVRRWMVLHDTVTFGENGEDGGPGLLPGLRRFLREHSNWSVMQHFDNNNGLTVLTCSDKDRPDLPSLPKMAWNYTKALARHLAAGKPVLPAESVQKRLDICLTCPQRIENRCTVCGCHLDQGPDGKDGKAVWEDQECPLGKWFAETQESQSV